MQTYEPPPFQHNSKSSRYTSLRKLAKSLQRFKPNFKSFQNIRRSLTSILPCLISHHLTIRLSIGRAVILLRRNLVLRPCNTCQTSRSYDPSYGKRQVAGDTVCWTQQVLVSPVCLQFQISKVRRTYLAWPSFRPAR